MAFTIEVHDQGVKNALMALAARVNNMDAVLQAVGDKMVERVKHRFDTSSGPDGVAWLPNKPATKKAKGGRPPLTDSGELRRQIYSSVSSAVLTVSASPEYAAIQQFGGTIERAAGSINVRHRTDAKGELLRSSIMNGKGLIFAKHGKNGHKRFIEREFAVAAHTITIPARPYMPIYSNRDLYPAESEAILAELNHFFMEGLI